MKVFITTLFFCVCGCLSACTDLPGDWEKMSIDDIAWEIEREVGRAAANSLRECKTIPIGTTLNGTPRGHLVYSKKSSDERKLTSLVSIYNEMDQERSKEENNPMVVQEVSIPPLKLVEGNCRGTSQFAWNPGDITLLHSKK